MSRRPPPHGAMPRSSPRCVRRKNPGARGLTRGLTPGCAARLGLGRAFRPLHAASSGRRGHSGAIRLQRAAPLSPGSPPPRRGAARPFGPPRPGHAGSAARSRAAPAAEGARGHPLPPPPAALGPGAAVAAGCPPRRAVEPGAARVSGVPQPGGHNFPAGRRSTSPPLHSILLPHRGRAPAPRSLPGDPRCRHTHACSRGEGSDGAVRGRSGRRGPPFPEGERRGGQGSAPGAPGTPGAGGGGARALRVLPAAAGAGSGRCPGAAAGGRLCPH